MAAKSCAQLRDLAAAERSHRSQAHDDEEPRIAEPPIGLVTRVACPVTSVPGRIVEIDDQPGRRPLPALPNGPRLVEQAPNRKATFQRLADRVSGIFVPVAIALWTLGFWLRTGGGAQLGILIKAPKSSSQLARSTPSSSP